jgi:hypothetical protein
VTAVLLTVILLTAIIIQQYRKRKAGIFTITIPSSKDAGEGDSHSDESTSLLAMQTHQAGGGAYYNAIQSDSSSEDLFVDSHTIRANE